jgi:oligopeptide transport system permease protein
MLGFIARRIVSLFFVLLFAVSLTFCLLRLAPGEPFNLSEKQITPENIEKQKKLYNLDGSLFSQWARYVGVAQKYAEHNNDGTVRLPAGYRGLLQGEFDQSLKLKDRKVSDLILQAIPTSMTIGLLALIIATSLGVWLGSLAAVKKHTWVDTATMLGALAAVSVPTFVVGPLLALVFALWLGWLPIGGLGGFSSYILPAVTLSGPFIAYIARLTRASLLEVLAQDFVRTAQAKGVSERRVLYRHVLKVGILPVVSFLGPLSAGVLTGSLVVERVFSLPGMGEFFVNSVLNRDMFLCCGAVVVYCTLLVLMNLLVDIAYQWLDPRIRLA